MGNCFRNGPIRSHSVSGAVGIWDVARGVSCCQGWSGFPFGPCCGGSLVLLWHGKKLGSYLGGSLGHLFGCCLWSCLRGVHNCLWWSTLGSCPGWDTWGFYRVPDDWCGVVEGLKGCLSVEDATEGLIQQFTVGGNWVTRAYCDYKPTRVVRITVNKVGQCGPTKYDSLC